LGDEIGGEAVAPRCRIRSDARRKTMADRRLMHELVDHLNDAGQC